MSIIFSVLKEEGVEFDEVGGVMQPVEEDLDGSSSSEGEGESIATSEMDTDTVCGRGTLVVFICSNFQCSPSSTLS